jgi:hypothetical protein
MGVVPFTATLGGEGVVEERAHIGEGVVALAVVGTDAAHIERVGDPFEIVHGEVSDGWRSVNGCEAHFSGLRFFVF